MFAGTGVRQPFPQNCASVISRIITPADSQGDGIWDDLHFSIFISVAIEIQDADGFRNIFPDVWVPGSRLAYTCANKSGVILLEMWANISAKLIYMGSD